MAKEDRCQWGVVETTTRKQHLGLGLPLGLRAPLKEALLLVADRPTP